MLNDRLVGPYRSASRYRTSIAIAGRPGATRWRSNPARSTSLAGRFERQQPSASKRPRRKAATISGGACSIDHGTVLCSPVTDLTPSASRKRLNGRRARRNWEVPFVLVADLERPVPVDPSHKFLVEWQDLDPVLGRAIDRHRARPARAAIADQPPEVVGKLVGPHVRESQFTWPGHPSSGSCPDRCSPGSTSRR